MSFIAAATIGGGLLAANSAKSSAESAAAAQTESADAAIAERQRQFDTVQELLAPYSAAGENSLSAQMALAGLSGVEAEQAQIDRITSGAQYGALVDEGENAILQNASATGGLRGGNTQSALAQFRPAVLSGLIDQQYSQLGGITGIGQASAAGTAAAAQNTGNAVSGLLTSQGDAAAGAALATGQANANLFGSIGSGVGTYLSNNPSTLTGF